MAQIVATMYSNLLITPKNSTIAVGAPPTKGDHLLVNDALLSGGAAAGDHTPGGGLLLMQAQFSECCLVGVYTAHIYGLS